MTIIKKFEPEQKKDFGKKYLAIAVVSLFLLMLGQIWASNNVVDYGEKLQELSQLRNTLKLQNQILENEIAKAGSLSTIASKSAELGFSRPESIQYIRQ